MEEKVRTDRRKVTRATAFAVVLLTFATACGGTSGGTAPVGTAPTSVPIVQSVASHSTLAAGSVPPTQAVATISTTVPSTAAMSLPSTQISTGLGLSSAGPSATPSTSSPALESTNAISSNQLPSTDVVSSAELSSSDDTPTSGPPVLQTNASGRTLGLADVFSTVGNWDEARYDVGDVSSILGLGAIIDSCGPNGMVELELRLAHHFNTLKMKVGESNSSQSSSDALVVQIIANGKQLDSRRIPFDAQQSFDLPIKDVNALKIDISLDPDKCEYNKSVTAVVEGMSVS